MCWLEHTNQCIQRNRVRFQRIDAATADTDTMGIKALFGRFASMRWLVTTFETNVRKHNQHIEFVCMDETLCNYYGTYHCDFKVYMPDKPGKYGLLFRYMADVVDRYVSRVIPYVTPPPAEKNKNNPSKLIHDLVMSSIRSLLF